MVIRSHGAVGHRLKLLGSALLAVCISGCDLRDLLETIFGNPLLKPATACGTFHFDRDCSEFQTCWKLVCEAIPGPRVKVGFDFEPTACDQTCSSELRDSPGTRKEASYRVEVIDVPVCVDAGSPCHHRALGYFRWGWTVANSNLQRASECDGQGWLSFCESIPTNMCLEMPDTHAQLALRHHKKAVCLALHAWNDNIGSRRPFPPELIADVCSET